jgi:predicted outer membrane repeat protein
VLSNSAGTNGGGIAYLGTGALLVQSSTVLSNSAGTDGGRHLRSIKLSMTIQQQPGAISNTVLGGAGGGVWTIWWQRRSSKS